MFPTEVLPVHYIEVSMQEQKARREAEAAQQCAQQAARAEAEAKSEAQRLARISTQPTAAQLSARLASLKDAMPTPLSQPQPGHGVIAGIYSNLFGARTASASPVISAAASTMPSRTQTPASSPRVEKTTAELQAERDQGICALPSWH